MRRHFHDIAFAARLIATLLLLVGGAIGVAVMTWSTTISAGTELASPYSPWAKNPWVEYAWLPRNGDALAQDASPCGADATAAAAPDLRDRSFEIAARLVVPETGSDGVVAAQGGRTGGWTLYLRDGKPVFHYNYLGAEHYTVAADRRLGPGLQILILSFAYDGGGTGRGGAVMLAADGEPIAAGRIDRTIPASAPFCERLDIGEDTGTSVSVAYDPPFRFRGEIAAVTVTLD
jgi:hypothetical protein